MILFAAIFWSSVLLLVYAHLGYPLLLWQRARRHSRPVQRGVTLPLLTVLVVAHDEAERIEGRIENLRALDYPPEQMNIVIGSDGSTDATVARARAFAEATSGAPVRVVDFAEQRGKPSVLNELIPLARGELIVLADARQRFETEALRALVAPFADPQVGAVSGELMLDADPKTGAASSGTGVYWKYEKFLRKHESQLDSTVGATGAIYAIRRSLFEPLPADTVLDDMLIPCRISRRGFRVIFEPHARAHDLPAEPAAELQRKARTLSGNFQLFAREGWLLDPRKNRLWLQTVSHKLLRLGCPLFLLGALLSSAALIEEPFYSAMLICQLAFYAAACAGGVAATRGKRIKLISTAYLFCLLHWATVLGFVRFVRGQASATWKTSSAQTAPLAHRASR